MKKAYISSKVRGEARIGSDTLMVEPGDYIAYPVGPERAHLVKNTGTWPLRYLCLSTVHPTEIVGYPDSKKNAGVGCVGPKTGILGANQTYY